MMMMMIWALGRRIEVLWVELKQILHLKVDCSDFGPVWDRGSLPYLGIKM